MCDHGFESRVLAFEKAWQQHDPPSIAFFLAGSTCSTPHDRLRLLIELICIDLEFRWQLAAHDPAGPERLKVEDYADKFTELGGADSLPLELIAEEYRVQQRWGTRPGHDQFLARFKAREHELRQQLQAIDRELQAEAHEPPESSRPRPSGPSIAHRSLPYDAPLLSHRDLNIQRMIGAGRMGKVYAARVKDTGRTVAVKFLRKSFLRDSGLVERFLSEATTIAKLNHPNIVGILGLGQSPGGGYFIVMNEMFDSNLDQRMKTRPVDIGDAVRWTVEACDALHHAHARGVIHCDLKPANLLLDEDGGIHVADFGLARTLNEADAAMAEIEGTAAFMAPEQAASCWGRIDVRTDVYGLGAVLYTLLAGRPPWTGRTLPDIFAQVVSGAAVTPLRSVRPDVPEVLSNVCGRCLAKSQADRYPTVRDLGAALAGIE